MALLDSQCRAGNWISKRLVQRLGKGGEISQDYTTPNLQDVNGHDVEPCGTISLEWWWHPQGIRVYECDFYVFANSDHLDVVLGAQCIFRERLLEAPKNQLAVLTEHMRQKDGECLTTCSRGNGSLLNIWEQMRPPKWLPSKKNNVARGLHLKLDDSNRQKICQLCRMGMQSLEVHRVNSNPTANRVGHKDDNSWHGSGDSRCLYRSCARSPRSNMGADNLR